MAFSEKVIAIKNIIQRVNKHILKTANHPLWLQKPTASNAAPFSLIPPIE